MSIIEITMAIGTTAMFLVLALLALDIAYDNITGTSNRSWLKYPGSLCVVIAIVGWSVSFILKIWGF